MVECYYKACYNYIDYRHENHILYRGCEVKVKKIGLIFTFIVVFSLSSCSTKNENALYKAKLSDREKTILSMEGNPYFAFDFNADDKYNWVEIWVDSYEFGRKISRCGQLKTDLSKDKKGTIIVLLNEIEKKKHEWIIAVTSGSGSASVNHVEDYNEKYESLSFKTSGANNSEKIPVNENEIILGHIFCTGIKNGEASISYTTRFYESSNQALKEIKDIDFVYLIMAKFYKHNPNNTN